MKKILLFLMLLSATSAFAQDVIVKKDGSTIVSKVLEITSTEVKYKKFTNQNGPTYTIMKDEVQVINYENGEKDTFEITTPIQTQLTEERTNQDQLQSDAVLSEIQLSNSQRISDNDLLRIAGVDYSKKARRLRIAGLIVGPTLSVVGAILTISGIDYYERGGNGWYETENEPSLLIPGSILLTGGAITLASCLIRAHKLQKRSELYVHSAPLYQYNIAFNNATSLSTGVDFLKDSHLHSQTLGLGIRYNF